MPQVNLLTDVDPVAITICKAGANKQRIFLKKSEGDKRTEVQLPRSQAGIIRKAEGDDWSVFYCVVAEPDAEEGAGLVGDQAVPDVWASPDEIRKAAHRLLKNDGYVNALHDAAEAEGCHIVENVVAPADFEILSPDGTATTIKKGTWYVGIEPSDEFKAAVDAGEIQGVSLEGIGYRTLIEKSEGESKDKKIRRALKGLADLVGMDLGDAAAPQLTPVAKGQPATFSDFFAVETIRDEMPRAIWALEDSLYAILDPAADVDSGDRIAKLKESLDGFAGWAEGVLSDIDSATATSLQKQLATLKKNRPLQEEDVPVTEEDFNAVKQTAEQTAEKLDGLTTLLKQHLNLPDEPGDKPEPQKNEPAEGSLESRLAKAEAMLERLGEGGSQISDEEDVSYEELKKVDPELAYAAALL